LKSFEKGQADIVFSDQEITAPIEEIIRAWTGQFIILWQPPFEDIDTFAQGYIGPNVLWLRHTLDHIEGLPPAKYTKKNLEFDHALAERVKQMQANLSLVADGIIGPETFIAFANADTDSKDGPRLMQITNENKDG